MNPRTQVAMPKMRNGMSQSGCMKVRSVSAVESGEGHHQAGNCPASPAATTGSLRTM